MFDGNMNIGDILKKAQELSSTMQEQQEKLAQETVDVSVGGEMVKMSFNGRQEALSIHIDPEVVDPNDIQTLQDLILAAVNEGIRRSQEKAQGEMSKYLGPLKNMGFPGMG